MSRDAPGKSSELLLVRKPKVLTVFQFGVGGSAFKMAWEMDGWTLVKLMQLFALYNLVSFFLRLLLFLICLFFCAAKTKSSPNL